MNVCYSSRKGKNDPEGDPEIMRTTTTIRGPEASLSLPHFQRVGLPLLFFLYQEGPIHTSGVELTYGTLGAPPNSKCWVQLLSGKALEVELLSQ